MNHQCFQFRTFTIASFTVLNAVFSALFSPDCGADQFSSEKIVDSRVTAVTLYRTQALITRTIDLTGAVGSQEIIVGDLPENIDANSLFAESDKGAEVRAVRYRASAVSNSPRQEVRAIENRIEDLENKTRVNKKHRGLILKQEKYLDKLETFTPPAANFDLGRGVLNSKEIEQLTNFSFNQREQVLELDIKLDSDLREFETQLEFARTKLRELTDGATKQERQAVLFIQKTEPGNQSIRLNYLTTSCSWSPTYTVRANTGAEKVRIEYNGLIQQMSGEDWNNVRLTLSTASPAISAAGPGLAPFRLTLTAPRKNTRVQQQSSSMINRDSGLQSLLKQQTDLISGNRFAISNADNLRTSWAINNVVNNVDRFAITSDVAADELNSGASNENGEEPALSYEIKSLVSLPSRNNQQMVRVLETDLESDFYHIATPVLTSYVYREAELNNNSGEDLLAGPLTVYLDGRFVGRSEIPTVARGQAFVVGLGADSQLRSTRVLVNKTNAINGGNRETKLDYKLTISNYKTTVATIRIIDRMPIAGDESGIRVTLGSDIADTLSKDEVYVRKLFPKGILRWDVEVAGRSVDANAHETDYSFALEYDRNYSVSLPGNLQEQEIEYNKMENSRRGRKR